MALLPGVAVIHLGECIAWLEALEDRSAGVAITDPPYSEHVHNHSLTSKAADIKGSLTSKGNKRFDPVKRDLGFGHLTPSLRRAVANELARVTQRWILVFSDEEGVADWRYDLRGAGLEVVRVCPWVKPDSAPQMTGDRPGCGWEPIIVAHQTNVKRKPTIKRWNGGGHKGVFCHNVNSEERTHMTEKPIALLLELVSLFSDPDELVIDPFAGAGTTGVACVRLGRRFAGVELDPACAELAAERLDAEQRGLSVRELRAGQGALFGAPATPPRATEAAP